MTDNVGTNDEKYKSLKIGDIPKEVQDAFKALINEFDDIFDWNRDRISLATSTNHYIITDPGVHPIQYCLYCHSPAENEFLKKELKHFMDLKIIEPCSSPWATTIILVRKKTHKL